MTGGVVRATGYVVVKGHRYGKAVPVSSASLRAVRLSKPRMVEVDEVVVRLTLVLPVEAFEALATEATIAAVDLVRDVAVHVVEAEPDVADEPDPDRMHDEGWAP